MNNIVKINDTDLQVIEYRGQRMATHAQIDTVHKRPEGTAGRNFREHKHRFIEEQDFFEVDQPDEIRRLGFERPQGGTPSKIILMTEQGYTMLVKPFTDDLAWQVQRQVVTGYFRAKDAGILGAASAENSADLRSPQKAKPARVSERYREAAAITRDQLKICKLLGVDDGMAKVITAKEVRNATGLDFTPLLTNTTATDNPRLTVKELAERIGGGASSEQVNSALEQLGFQVKKHWTGSQGKPRRKWELTGAGKKFGALATYQAQEHEHSGYRPVWFASVIDLIQPLVVIAIAQRAAPKPKRANKSTAPAVAPEPQGALL